MKYFIVLTLFALLCTAVWNLEFPEHVSIWKCFDDSGNLIGEGEFKYISASKYAELYYFELNGKKYLGSCHYDRRIKQ